MSIDKNHRGEIAGNGVHVRAEPFWLIFSQWREPINSAYSLGRSDRRANKLSNNLLDVWVICRQSKQPIFKTESCW